MLGHLWLVLVPLVLEAAWQVGGDGRLTLVLDWALRTGSEWLYSRCQASSSETLTHTLSLCWSAAHAPLASDICPMLSFLRLP